MTDTPGTLATTLVVNGRPYRLSLDPRTTLLDALRETMNLTGSKKGCDQGQCGACTVLVGGVRVLSCFVLAALVEGKVTTIEGLSAIRDGPQRWQTGGSAGSHPAGSALGCGRTTRSPSL